MLNVNSHFLGVKFFDMGESGTSRRPLRLLQGPSVQAIGCGMPSGVGPGVDPPSKAYFQCLATGPTRTSTRRFLILSSLVGLSVPNCELFGGRSRCDFEDAPDVVASGASSSLLVARAIPRRFPGPARRRRSRGAAYSTHSMEKTPELYSLPSLPVTNSSQLRVAGVVGQPWKVRLGPSLYQELPLLVRTQR